MRTTVWKFELNPDVQLCELMMPAGARILHFGAQEKFTRGLHHLSIWAEVDTEAEKIYRTFLIIGTGHPRHDLENMNYIGTAMDGMYVWHLYEVRREQG